MADRPTQGYIPPNLNEDGGVFGGMLKMRNLVEAGICGGGAFMLTNLLSKIVPVFSVVIMLVGIVLALIIALIAVMGVRGEPLSIFILNIINYRQTSGYVPIRMPMPMSVEANEKKKGESQSSFEKKLTRALNGKK